MTPSLKTCAIIPAFNEGRQLAAIIRKIQNFEIEVIVIDDGSKDETAAIAQNQGAFLIKHSFNKGKGVALRSGFQYALEKKFDEIITIDGDGQHNPDEIPLFLNKSRSSEAGIIIGNRMHAPTGMPFLRVFCNTIGSKMISSVCGHPLSDALSGYRVIKRKVLESITLENERFDIDAELLIKASRAGFGIDFIPIECIYAQERSRIRPLRDGYQFFRIVLGSAFRTD